METLRGVDSYTIMPQERFSLVSHVPQALSLHHKRTLSSRFQCATKVICIVLYCKLLIFLFSTAQAYLFSHNSHSTLFWFEKFMTAQFYLFVQTETACFCIEYFLQPHVYFHFYILPHVKSLTWFDMFWHMTWLAKVYRQRKSATSCGLKSN